MSRARRGDGAAFGWLVAIHADVAFRSAYLVVADAAEAEVLADVAPEVSSATLHSELGKLLRELRPFWSEAGERLEQAALGQPTLSGCTVSGRSRKDGIL